MECAPPTRKELGSGSLLSAPKEKKLSLRLRNAFSAISEKCIRPTSEHIGFSNKERVHLPTLLHFSFLF